MTLPPLPTAIVGPMDRNGRRWDRLLWGVEFSSGSHRADARMLIGRLWATEWAKEIRFDVQKVRRRLNRGWSFERAISAGYDRAASLKDTKHLISQHPTPSSARC